MVPVQQNDRVFVGKEYIVEANDSLQSIAHRFGTSEENLVSVFMQSSSQDCSIHPFHCFTIRNSPISFSYASMPIWCRKHPYHPEVLSA